MQKTCKQCAQQFEITEEDLIFYEKISPVFGGKKYLIPEPTLCPDCRLQRRIAFRNFWNLYNRTCDLTQKPMISMYAADPMVTCKIYDQAEWWSDKWDALTYGRDINWDEPFFRQFEKLYREVPKYAVMNANSENCTYSNMVATSKNCYLVFGCIEDENCYYGHIVWKSQSAFDCSYVFNSELCYECVDCDKCYNLQSSQDCNNCTDSAFLLDCSSCQNCFGCVGLKNKQYHIFNQPFSKEKYFEELKKLQVNDRNNFNFFREKLKELSLNHSFKYIHGQHIEHSTGDYLNQCKNVENSFDLISSEDAKYCYTGKNFKSTYDVNFSGLPLELGYENLFVTGYNICFSINSSNGSQNLYYCDSCYGCKDCFGCVGMKQKKYCVFNKQYTEEEYNKLVPEIIKKMRLDGEWGEFFPIHISPFGYNETMANEYFPMQKEEVIRKGWKWSNDQLKAKYVGGKVPLPSRIQDTNSEITQHILSCETCEKNYKIIPQEFEFHKKIGAPIPTQCFQCRNRARLKSRNPRKLWNRVCSKCSQVIKTSFAPDRPEKVYCEACYLKEVY